MNLIYSKMKVFHFKKKIDSLPIDNDRILPPIHIRIKPTNVCGHNCWYCAYRADNLQLGQNMVKRDFIKKEKMMEIMDDIIEMGVKAITFSGGGDPFYYPYLLDAIKKLSQAPVKFASLTNGSRLQGEEAKIFAHHGTWLRVSMDGWNDESYSKYRGVKLGEFSKIMGNMKSFKNLGGNCYLGVSLVIDKDNASHICNLIGKLKDVGVDSVKVSPCIVSNDASENDRYHLPIHDCVKKQVKKAKENFEDDNFEIFDSFHTFNNEFQKEYEWCPYLQILPIIGADLNIYSCQDKAYNMDEGLIGSIKNQRFKDFWFSDKKNFFKINPSKVCNHHCVSHEKNKMILEYLNSDSTHLSFV